jgi:hypothetical protein
LSDMSLALIGQELRIGCMVVPDFATGGC